MRGRRRESEGESVSCRQGCSHREGVEELLVDASDDLPVGEDGGLLVLAQRPRRAQRLQALLAEEREVGHAAARRTALVR